MFHFFLEPNSGVAPFQQLVNQVRNALRLGQLQQGDQLPTVREVVAELVINPNTVLKAYRELEHEGLIISKPGSGTFIQRTLGEVPVATLAKLRRSLALWIREGQAAGLDDESLRALFHSTFREIQRHEEKMA